MKKINLVKSSCVGCGACISICKEHFEFDDEGLSRLVNPTESEPAILDKVEEAIGACPTSAISTEDINA